MDEAVCVTIKTMGHVPVWPPGSGGQVRVELSTGRVDVWTREMCSGLHVHTGVMCVPTSEAVNPGMKTMGPVSGPYRVRGRWLQVYNPE